MREGRGRPRSLLISLLLTLLLFPSLSWNTAFVDESAALATEGGAVATAAVEVTMPEGPVSAMTMAAGPMLGKAGLLGKSKTALTKADEAGEAVAKLAGSSAKVSSAASDQAGRVGGWAKQFFKKLWKDETGSIPGKSLKKLAEQKGAAEKSLLPPKRIKLKGGTKAARGGAQAVRVGQAGESAALAAEGGAVAEESATLAAEDGAVGGAAGGTNRFIGPKVFTNRHGQLTNGRYILDDAGMMPHTTGSLAKGKSQFLYRVNEKQLTLDAAAYADEAGLWVGNKAKVVLDDFIGVHAGTGTRTQVLNIYRTDSGFIHAAPGSPL